MYITNNHMQMDLKQIMQNQPIINIGMIGHVSNGKSSLVKSLTGIETQKFSNEKERNITIKLGYANAKIYKCDFCNDDTYVSTPSNVYNKKCSKCDGEMDLVTHVSFVDSPGHIQFMSTMISGKCIMDTTILVEALNNSVLPAPQTLEHLKAIELGNITNSIICFNKCDLVEKRIALANINTIRTEFESTSASKAQMIPVSATFDINIDILCKHIANIQIPQRDLSKELRMIIVRSFDVNRPGTEILKLCGGVIGGSVVQGIIKVGDKIQLTPGYVKLKDIINEPKKKRQIKTWEYKPLKATVVSIKSENNTLEFAIAGGLIGVQLDIDPALTINDHLVGNVLSHCNNPNVNVFEAVGIKYIKKDASAELVKGDIVKININAYNTNGTIAKAFKENDELMVAVVLDKPISAYIGDSVTICFNERIYGNGTIIEGIFSDVF